MIEIGENNTGGGEAESGGNQKQIYFEMGGGANGGRLVCRAILIINDHTKFHPGDSLAPRSLQRQEYGRTQQGAMVCTRGQDIPAGGSYIPGGGGIVMSSYQGLDGILKELWNICTREGSDVYGISGGGGGGG